MEGDFDLEELVHLEQTFYETGYEDGFAHGRIHGLIEGRALGRAKGFEMWEELGFYEGFARMWMSIYEKQGRNDELHLIAQFPRVNPSAALDEDMDFAKLFRQIRSRYKVLCSTLGVRPTLRYSEKSQDRDEGASEVEVEGRPAAESGSVWKVEKRAAANHTF